MSDCVDHVNRRQFIRRAAVVGTLVWTVPTIVTIQPASASSAAPHRRVLSPVSSPPETPPTTFVRAVAVKPKTETNDGTLPFTGDGERRDLALGLGALTAGIAAVMLSNDERSW
jgi:hypothetical protein